MKSIKWLQTKKSLRWLFYTVSRGGFKISTILVASFNGTPFQAELLEITWVDRVGIGGLLEILWPTNFARE